MAITDKGMQAKATGENVWLTQPFKRGAGVFLGRITAGGERLFYFRYTDSKGTRPFLPIGAYHPKGEAGGMTLAEAYRVASEWSTLYQSGVRDLREHFAQAQADEKQAAADARAVAEAARQTAELEAARRLTVRQLFERWCATELQPTARADGRRAGRKDGGAYVRAQFERHVFPAIGNHIAKELRKADLLALIDTQKGKGQLRTASVLLGDLRQMLHFALDRELIDVDPLATVKKARIVGVPVERDRALSDDEVRALAPALAASRLRARSVAAVWLILATGARAGEAMGAVWSDALPSNPSATRARLAELRGLGTEESEGLKVGIVDLASRTWRLPDTKNQRPHTIHLSEFAVCQFESLATLRPKLAGLGDTLSPWVFPGSDPARPVCIKSFGKQLADRQRERDPGKPMSGRSKHTEALRLPGGKWTAHDLRRTAATIMARLGISGDVIDEALNHMLESRMRRVYIQHRREAEQARAFDALGARLSELQMSTKPASNVIALHAARGQLN